MGKDLKKEKINLIGSGFKHCVSTNGYILPKKVEWVLDNSADISIHVDSAILYPVDHSKTNYAMLSESKTIIGHLYQKIIDNIDFLESNYEYIFTHDISLLDISKKIKLIPPPATSWILEKDRKLYNKTKLVSMIASTKRMCPDHYYRNQIAKKFSDKIDIFGRGRPHQIENKLEGLKEYCFSIAMENGKYNNMFTEKITDCFVVGTIPVYYGSSSVSEYFNPEGIINLKDFLLSDLTYNLYRDKILYIKENFEIACNFPHPEDFIWEKYIK